MAGADMSGYPGSGIPILPGRVPYAGADIAKGEGGFWDTARQILTKRPLDMTAEEWREILMRRPFGSNDRTGFADDGIEGMDNLNRPGQYGAEFGDDGIEGMDNIAQGARSPIAAATAADRFDTMPVPRSKPERESLRAGGSKTTDALSKNITPSATSGASYDENYKKNLEIMQGGDDPFASIEKRAKAREAKLDARENSDMWMSVAKAGFAMAAGTSQYAGVNIGEGALAGVNQLSKDRAAANKSRERIDASRDALDIARVGEARAQRGDAHRLTAGQTQDRQFAATMDLGEKRLAATKESGRERLESTEKIAARTDKTNQKRISASVEAALGKARTKREQDHLDDISKAKNQALTDAGKLDEGTLPLAKFLPLLRARLRFVPGITKYEVDRLVEQHRMEDRPSGKDTDAGSAGSAWKFDPATGSNRKTAAGG